jgi:casein kinase 1
MYFTIFIWFHVVELICAHNIPRVDDRMKDALVGESFKLGEYLGGGGFGLIYGGYNIYSGKQVAIKLEIKNISRPRLRREATIYHRCNGTVGFPKIYWFGDFEMYSALVIERLGQNLVKLISQTPKDSKFSVLYPLIPQMIERLEVLHNNRFLHHDVSPSNFVIGRQDPNIVHIIDFGSSIYHRPGSASLFKADSNRHIKTVAFCSASAMQGYDYSPADDLIALGYSVVGLTIGLPWGHTKDQQEVLHLKLETSLEELCGEKGHPLLAPCLQFFSYLQRASDEDSTQQLDYDYMKTIFSNKKRKTSGLWAWMGL